MFKIAILALALPLVSLSPSKKAPSEQTSFCNAVKYVIARMQNSKEFNTLKDDRIEPGTFNSKLKFSGWDFATVTDSSDGFIYTCFSSKATESNAKKLFKNIRSELIECFKLDPESADDDDDDAFSIFYFPADADPTSNAAISFTLFFYPEDKVTGSYISLAMQKFKD